MPEYYAIVRMTFSRQYDFKSECPEEAIKKARELAKKDAISDAEINIMVLEERETPNKKDNNIKSV